jgi:hypothetical protein
MKFASIPHKTSPENLQFLLLWVFQHYLDKITELYIKGL